MPDARWWLASGLIASACGLPPMGTPAGASSTGDDASGSSTSPTTSTSAGPGSTSEEPTTTGSPDGTSSSSTGITPGCGNGITEEGEECDLGPDNGVDGVDCTADCTADVCGDGHVGSDEDCDGTAGCDTACTSGAIDVAAGTKNTCVILADGGFVKCWGDNSQYRAGIPRPTGALGATPQTTPDNLDCVRFDPDEHRPAKQVALGDGFACVLFEDGGVICWGEDFGDERSVVPEDLEGMLPLGFDDTQQLLVALAQGMPGLDRIAAGDRHACGTGENVTEDRTEIWCWGNNDYEQVGPDCMGDDPCLGRVDVGGDVVDFSVGLYHNCAIVDRGGAGNVLTCWGRDSATVDGVVVTGLLGLDPMLPSDPASAAVAVSDAGGLPLMVAAGFKTTCVVVTEEDLMRCWGSGTYLTLGTDSIDYVDEPIYEAPSANLDGAVVVRMASSPGKETGAVVVDDGRTVYTWGRNQFGQLGHGPKMFSDRVALDPDNAQVFDSVVTKLALGGSHMCAVFEDGAVRCWGRGTAGRLGSGSDEAYGDDPGETAASADEVALGSCANFEK